MMDPNAPTPAEQLARFLHEAYEDASFGGEVASWDILEDSHKQLYLRMAAATVTALLEGKIIEYPDPGDKLAMLLGRTEDGKIRVDFQKPLKWFAMDKDHAINFALTILQHCGVPVTVTLNS